MRMVKRLFVVLVVMAIAVASAFAGAAQWSNVSVVAPAISVSGSAKITSVAVTTGISATACTANSSRLGGVLANASTNYLYCSFTSTTPAVANAFILYPAGSTTGKSEMAFNENGVCYQGPIYFVAYDSDFATRGVGKVSVKEYK